MSKIYDKKLHDYREETDEEFYKRVTGSAFVNRPPKSLKEQEDEDWWMGPALVVCMIIAFFVLFWFFQTDFGQAQVCGGVEWKPCPS